LQCTCQAQVIWIHWQEDIRIGTRRA
jgi:hypothetical protein